MEFEIYKVSSIFFENQYWLKMNDNLTWKGGHFIIKYLWINSNVYGFENLHITNVDAFVMTTFLI